MNNSSRSGGSQPRTLLMRGIELLSRREHSRMELHRKLCSGLREGETVDDVIEVLDLLEKRGYLSNERYAQSRVRTRAARYGNMRLARELSMSGVSSEDISEALDQAGSEYERAKKVWARKFSAPPADYKERGKQIRFLASRGFGFDVINRVLRSAGDDECDLCE